MDLIMLVYGDPWSPDLPQDAALRPGLVRAFALARRAAQRLTGRRDVRACTTSVATARRPDAARHAELREMAKQGAMHP